MAKENQTSQTGYGAREHSCKSDTYVQMLLPRPLAPSSGGEGQRAGDRPPDRDAPLPAMTPIIQIEPREGRQGRGARTTKPAKEDAPDCFMRISVGHVHGLYHGSG